MTEFNDLYVQTPPVLPVPDPSDATSRIASALERIADALEGRQITYDAENGDCNWIAKRRTDDGWVFTCHRTEAEARAHLANGLEV